MKINWRYILGGFIILAAVSGITRAGGTPNPTFAMIGSFCLAAVGILTMPIGDLGNKRRWAIVGAVIGGIVFLGIGNAKPPTHPTVEETKPKIDTIKKDTQKKEATAKKIKKDTTIAARPQLLNTHKAEHHTTKYSNTSVQCSETTQKGKRCKKMTKNANGRCHLHQ